MARAPSAMQCTATRSSARSVYDWVRELCIALGAAPEDLVPFEKYAAAAANLGCTVVGRARDLRRRVPYRAS